MTKRPSAGRDPNLAARPICPDCGSDNTATTPVAQKMPYRCADCKHYFSAKATVMLQQAGLPQVGDRAYLFLTNIKGITAPAPRVGQLSQRLAHAAPHSSSLRQRQPTAHGRYRSRGWQRKNKHSNKRLRAGRGTVGKATVVGAKARGSKRVQAAVIERASAHELVCRRGGFGQQGYSRPASGLRHSHGQYVDGDAHTNGIESFWSMLKRGYIGTYHTWSFKHLHRS